MASQLELTQKPFIELQIEALVEENQIKPKRVLSFLTKFEKLLLNIKESDIKRVADRGIRLPIIGRPNSMNEDYPKNFEFIGPQKIDIIGGFKTSSALKKTAPVDIAVCMPAKCLTPKDTKNQRYHSKRALYLSYLAHILNGRLGSRLISRIEFQYHQGDFLKPILLITPKDEKLRLRTSFQLFVYPHHDSAIKLSHLHPSHGNVAPNWFFKNYPLADADPKVQAFIDSDSDISSTPFYNSTILHDLESVQNSDILYEQIGTHVSLIEALVLTKIWLYQRDLHQHFSFILSMYIAYLQTRQLVHQNMSSYQIFKVIIRSVASSEWSSNGLSYFDSFKDKISDYKPFFPVVFLSPTGNLNLCYNITNDLYERLKHEATLSQTILSSNPPDMFDMLFLRKVDSVKKFDVTLHLPKCGKKLPMNLESLNKFMDHGVFTPRVYSNSIIDTLRRALTDRVILMQQSSDHFLRSRRWNLKSIPYDPSYSEDGLTLGLLLEPEKSLRIIDIGPSADTPEAENFRLFWEPKSQLRLQNGIISETVVWHVKSFSQRRAIIKYILNHALKRFDINNVIVHYTLLERYISLNNVSFKWREDENNRETISTEENQTKKRKRNELDSPIGVGEEIFQRVLQAYNALNKIVRSVENMEHSITSIQPVSHHLRSSAVFPPMPASLQQRNESLKRRKGVSLFPENFNQMGKILYIEPIEILLTLDSASKWPNEYEAFEAAKINYLLQLGEALKEKEYSVKFAEDYLDVLHGQFVFRLRLKCQKELAVLGAANQKQRLQRVRYETDILPRVHASLDQLYREKPAYGLTCRLVKRWLSCHFMTDHVSDIVLDLIVAHVFLHPQPYSEPASSMCGFQRFLDLVSQHDWKQVPLVVNFDEQLKIDEVIRLRESMALTERKDRTKFPPIVICTPYDKEMMSPWTARSNLDEMGLDMLVRICTKALQYFNKNVLLNQDLSADECKALFLPNFKIFDLLVKLNPRMVQNFFMSITPPRDFRLVGKEPSGNHASAFKVMPIVGLNIIEQYVNVLKDKYKDVAVFFYDKYGQRLIGIKLKPESEQVFAGDLSKFIMEIKSLGSKLVESVSVIKRDSRVNVADDDSGAES